MNRQSVAAMVLGFILLLLRKLAIGSSRLAMGQRHKDGGMSLYGRTVSIVGLGNIDKELLGLLQPFGCRILVSDLVYADMFWQQYQLQPGAKQTFLDEAYVVSLHVSLTPDTWYMINRETLASMRPDAFLSNNSRGAVVDDDESALKGALQTGVLAGAALDVYGGETPVDAELLGLPNLFKTPQIGGDFSEAVFQMGEAAVNNLRSFFENRSNDSMQAG